MKNYKDLVEGKATWEGNGVRLRVVNVKSSDYPASVYFDSNGNQVVSSKRFSPLAVKNPVRLRSGSYYKVETQLEIGKKLPQGVYARVVPIDGISEGGMIIVSDILQPGYKGPVSFSVFCARRIELDLDVCIARLEFYRDASETDSKSTSKSKGGES